MDLEHLWILSGRLVELNKTLGNRQLEKHRIAYTLDINNLGFTHRKK